MKTLRAFTEFVTGSLRIVLRGNALYWCWVAALLVLMLRGFVSYLHQLHVGLIATSMRDQVTCAF